jgi:DNA-binding phage protein
MSRGDQRRTDPVLRRAAAELRAIVAANIRVVATKRGVSLNRLVDFAGVTRSSFYRAMAGRGAMTLDTLAKIAAALEVTPAWLCERRDAGAHGRR